MSILVTLLVTLVMGMLLGIALERWWPQFQRSVNALNDYWIGAEVCDAGNLLLGILLIGAPWIFEFNTGLQSQNAVATGIIVTVFSIAAFVGFAAWEEWGNLIAGLWLVVSPWILSFSGPTKWYQVTIGIAIAALAKNELWFRGAAAKNSSQKKSTSHEAARR